VVLALTVSFLAGLLGAAISPRAQRAVTHTPPPLASVTFAGTPTSTIPGQVAAISSGVIVVTTVYGQVFEVATKPGTRYFVHPADTAPVSRTSVTVGVFVVARGTANGSARLTADSITVLPQFRGVKPGFEGRATPYP
jgi:hypothetical protein